ncbi:MAG: cytochrome c biosis protein CcmG, thiol:disulfide interchange protein DsbE [Actinomycetota bacterium]|nr:cytochrome c biosis protein CcmG, thiol:disulfide interchange protein DsbE [Actinomycetota bacterium]
MSRTPRLVAVAVATCLLAGLAGCTGDSDMSAPSTSPAGASPAAMDLDAVPACPAVPKVAPRDDGLPPLRLACLGSGPAVRLSDLRGTPMVLNVWAAWCTLCPDEEPFFAALHRKVGDKVRFFGIHYKAGRSQGLQSARDFGVFFPSVHDADGDRTVKALRTTAPPQTFFVTAAGRVAHRHVGVLKSQAQFDALVAKYLGVKV